MNCIELHCMTGYLDIYFKITTLKQDLCLNSKLNIPE
jgi:hypothetical protein